ncbi:hypothetical protein FQR65_LT12119 [Abscondita terminalis]|nr:hypothetical protein FQR65_LT12119 [Abscondita terminalis]
MGSKRTALNAEDGSSKKLKTDGGHWSLGLLDAIKDPDNLVRQNATLVVIKDKYPKAKFHYLIVPKEDISSLKQVRKEHIKLMEQMQAMAEDIIEEDRHKESNFKIGFHAEASMLRLHLHVISDDMNSNSVKTKKHWNSFTTKFFLDSKEVLSQLKRDGAVSLPSAEICKELLNTPIKCHKCKYIPKHMPDLKKHIITHLQKA